jgi:serine-type D-Ala-D-Ala carboxypeptidase/endopeptidase
MSTYTVDQLYQFFATFDVPADVGSRWGYSNKDAGVLGLVLARRLNTSYEELLTSVDTQNRQLMDTSKPAIN